MQGKLYIDGKDAYSVYRVFVEQYGYKEVIQFPQFKTIDITDWPEEDGIEADLTSPVLNTRTCAIQFCITDVELASSLYELLSDGAYHNFNFIELKRTYRLRLVNTTTYSQMIRLGKMTLSFADDFPYVPRVAPFDYGISSVRQRGYEIDGIDLSRFGCWMLDGSLQSIRKAPAVKLNLTISAKGVAGVQYDQQNVLYKSKDITLKLLINARSIEEFWHSYESLFSVLLQAEERRFTIAHLDEHYPCYYKSCKVSRFDILPNGHIWCEFDVVLVSTSARPIYEVWLLATENGTLILTEDEEHTIKLTPTLAMYQTEGINNSID